MQHHFGFVSNYNEPLTNYKADSLLCSTNKCGFIIRSQDFNIACSAGISGAASAVYTPGLCLMTSELMTDYNVHLYIVMAAYLFLKAYI